VWYFLFFILLINIYIIMIRITIFKIYSITFKQAKNMILKQATCMCKYVVFYGLEI